MPPDTMAQPVMSQLQSPHSAHKRALLRAIATVTPMRSRAVREWTMRQRWWLQRLRRRRLERRGDSRLSRPALHGMDVRLAEILGDGGVFVEAGANDGYQQSNTYYLERFHGWSGVLVEPIPALYREAAAERLRSQVFNAALVAPDHVSGTVRMRFGGLMSIVAGSYGSERDDLGYVGIGFGLRPEDASYEVEVRARTLSDVLDEAGVGEIDLLSLDVEGYEPQVLAGLDLERHAPRRILIEVQDMARADETVMPMLAERYEFEAEMSPMDVLLRRRGP